MRFRTGRTVGAASPRMPSSAGRWVVMVASVTLLSGSFATSAAPAKGDDSGRPNIVFILSDDQRYDSMWSMPIVQRDLADRGVTLTNYFLTDPLCCPSRSSIMRGQYPHGTGVYNNDDGPYGGYPRFHQMGDDLSNIATWLQTAGYHTGLIGKYLNGYRDARTVPPGWDTWNALVIDRYYRFAESVNGTYRSYPTQYQTDVLGQQALDFIDSTPAGTPLFLYWAPHAPHADATPAPQDIGSFSWLDPYRPPSFNEPDVSDKPVGMQKPLLTDAQIAATDAFRERQYETLQDVDRWVGHIIDDLQASGRLSNTLLVYTTDNGIMYGEHRLTMTKNVGYEEAIRSPFVARWDGVIPAGTTDTHLALNIDLAPTFASVAGATPTNEVDGTDLMPVLNGTLGGGSWRHDFLIEHGGGAGVAPPFCAVRSDSGFFYADYFTSDAEELYDLNADPYEISNVASDPAYSDVLHSMRERLRQLCVPEPPVLANQYRPPGTVPDVAASPGTGEATVTWSLPPSDGGSPLTSFTVTASPGGMIAGVGGSATSATVEGLVAFGTYTFTVTATNAFGTGPASAPSNPVTLGEAGAPAAPTEVVATPGEGSASVSWIPGADGGSPVTTYTVTSSPDGVTMSVDGATTSATFDGLTDGNPYTFTVTATNAVGTGPPSDPSNAVVPGVLEAPMAPDGVTATPGDTSAAVRWSAPRSDGGSPITAYSVTSSPDGVTVTVDGQATSATLDGLTDGVTYTFTVTAVNEVGPSPPSDPSNAVVPGPVGPQITGFTPIGARVGRPVTIMGFGLSSAQSVLFGGVSASFQVVSDQELTTSVPFDAVSGPISVIAPDGSTSSQHAFAVLPHISSFDPSGGPVNTEVTVVGSAFADVTDVRIGGRPVRFTVVAYSTIRLRVNDRSLSGPITVVTKAGRTKSLLSFVVIVVPQPRAGVYHI